MHVSFVSSCPSYARVMDDATRLMPPDLLEQTLADNEYIPEHIIPTERQLAFLELECRDALFGGAAGGGKALDTSTPIATPTGWIRMGEIGPGDFVFGSDGKPTRVIATSGVMTGRPCFRITFDTGEQITADAEHLWHTFTARELTALTRRDPEWRAKRRASRASRSNGRYPATFTASLAARNKLNPPPVKPGPTGGVRTTLEISNTVRAGKRSNHAIRLAGPLALARAELPIDPYLLGVWLGDGRAQGGGISSADPEIVQAFRDGGYEINRQSGKYAWGTKGLTTQLRNLGLLENKHIPPAYLRGDFEQRLALLQGLMDTDGYCRENGGAEFTNTNRRLAEGVFELVASLGCKPGWFEGVARLNGRAIGPKYVVNWRGADPAFRLPRKLERQKRAGISRRTRFRFVAACEPVESVPVCCIQVEAADGMFLAGRGMIPTHNSEALLMAALQFVHEPGYAALIVRRNTIDLKLPGGLIDRSAEWLKEKAHFNAQENRWRFKTGSTLQFGYADREGDEKRYHGAEFQFIGIDEAVQFTENQIKFFFERLRRKESISVPLRMRLATTPGGPGHEFIKRRYIKPGTPGKVFVPAKLTDNPHLNTQEYIESLAEVGDMRRDQMLKGDWDAVEGGRFKREWFGWWRQEGGRFDPANPSAGGPRMVLTDFGGSVVERFDPSQCGRFQTCDPAASTSAAADYFVNSTWLVTPRANVVWWGCHRGKHQIREQITTCQRLYRQYQPQFVAVEAVMNQTALLQELTRSTSPFMVVRRVSPLGRDKLARAAGAINLAASGRVFLPEKPPADFPLDDVIQELVRFTGDDKKDAHDDVVDTFSYAAQLLPMVRPGAGSGTSRPPTWHASRSTPWSGLT